MDDQIQEQYDISVGKIFSNFLCLYALNVFVRNFYVIESSMIIVGICFAISIMVRINYIKCAFNSMIFMEMIFFAFLVFTLLRYSGYNRVILIRCFWTIAFCIPMFALFYKVSNLNMVLAQTSHAVTFVIVLMLVVTLTADRGQADYDMTVGYILLYPICFSMSRIRENKKYICLVLMSGLIILVYGSRGPLLAVMIFALMIFLFDKEKRNAENFVWRMILVFFVIIVCFFYREILLFVRDIFNNKGISVRTIEKLLMGNIAVDSGRSIFYDLAIKNIHEKPILGWGIAGDVVCMEQYPHLLFLEIVLDFGYIIGGMLSLFVLYRIIKTFIIFHFKNEELCILFCCGFVPLLLSHSYLQEPLFWVLMGFSCSKNAKEYSHKSRIHNARFIR